MTFFEKISQPNGSGDVVPPGTDLALLNRHLLNLRAAGHAVHGDETYERHGARVIRIFHYPTCKVCSQ